MTTLSGVEQKIVLAPSNGTTAVELKNLQVFSGLYGAHHFNLTLGGQVLSLALKKYFLCAFPPIRCENHQVPYVAIC